MSALIGSVGAQQPVGPNELELCFPRSGRWCRSIAPFTYLWKVFDESDAVRYWYVSKAVHGASRPRTHYRRNVDNLLAGRAYRKSKPTQFRLSHERLAEATKLNLSIKLSLVCNVDQGEDINAIERLWQRHYESLHSKAQQAVPDDAPNART
jgi:hypothetical protein